jgi:threonine dehydrogenase-like Zn-dependent dehydrogenase
MKAVVFDDRLKVVEREKPRRLPGEVLIRVERAGICNTDHEIIRGYVPGFSGILGHEFFGYVEEADDFSLAGKRVTAEINISCGECEFCRKGLGRHCANRAVLGIIGKGGAMAEYVAVPRRNVIEIPESITGMDAILIEPLAAVLEILEQTDIGKGDTVLLLGDGKLAQLIALVLGKTSCSLTAVGKHDYKLALIEKNTGARTISLDAFKPSAFDIVIEASGNPSAFTLGLSCVKPRGIFVLKSTYAGGFNFNPSPVVVNEITIIGSRCGRFVEAIRFLERYKPDLGDLISAEFPIDEALEAFEYSRRPDSLKVVLRIAQGKE